RLVLLALAVGTALGSTEMWSTLAHRIPSLGTLGLLAATTLLTLAVTRVRLLDGEPHIAAAGSTLALVCFSIVAWLGLLQLAGASMLALWAGGAVLSLVVVLAARQLAASAAVRRARVLELATLGRFSAQLAHD